MTPGGCFRPASRAISRGRIDHVRCFALLFSFPSRQGPQPRGGTQTVRVAIAVVSPRRSRACFISLHDGRWCSSLAALC